METKIIVGTKEVLNKIMSDGVSNDGVCPDAFFDPKSNSIYIKDRVDIKRSFAKECSYLGLNLDIPERTVDILVDALIAHEKTHAKQAHENVNFHQSYIDDLAYRFVCELEAFAAQANEFMKTIREPESPMKIIIGDEDPNGFARHWLKNMMSQIIVNYGIGGIEEGFQNNLLEFFIKEYDLDRPV